MNVLNNDSMQRSYAVNSSDANQNKIFIKTEYESDAEIIESNSSTCQSELKHCEEIFIKEEKSDYDGMEEPFECCPLKNEATNSNIGAIDGKGTCPPVRNPAAVDKTFLQAADIKSMTANDVNTEVPSCVTCRQPLATEESTENLSTCVDCHQSSGKNSTARAMVPSAGALVCSICNRSFMHKGNFRRHILIHNGTKKRFPCDTCENSFSRNEDLQTHVMKVHAKVIDRNQKLFPCSVCAKVYTRQYRLKTHMMYHSAVKPFICSVCSQSFVSNGALKRHETLHTDKKPFSCSVCGRTFTDNYGLKKHTMVHDNIKPFACSICSHSFMLQKDLTRHLMIHTNEKPFVCAVCNRSFVRKSHVKSHLKVHFKKSFSCPKCELMFTHKRNLKSHDCVGRENTLIHALTTLYQRIHHAI